MDQKGRAPHANLGEFMPVYQPNIPSGTVNLDVDYQNVQGNFQQLNIVYGTDHYPFDNATPNQGFHNMVTTPAVVNSPPDGLPPATTTNPKFYAYQQYAALGLLQYSRGPSNAVPTSLTNLHSTASPIVLAADATTNVLDFSGFTFGICKLFAINNSATADKSQLERLIVWSQNNFNTLVGGPGLIPVNSGNILQIKNNTAGTLTDVYWTLQIIRIK